MSQGQHESRNNVMCFCPHQVNVPSTLNQLSDYIDLIAKEKRTMLNPMAMPYVHKGDNRDFNDASEEKDDIEVKQKCNNEGDYNNEWMHEGKIFRSIQKKRTELKE